MPSDDELEVVKERIRALSADAFTSHYLLDRVPHIFADRAQYVEWKSTLAQDLQVDPYAIVVVGSSCLGWSLSPTKLFNPFHGRSDIDVAVISSMHFETAWKWLRQPGVRDLFSSSPRRNYFDKHRSSLVFDGTIATDKILNRLPYGAQWSRALRLAATRDPTSRRSVKARIYRDFDSLREYQRNNVRTVKESLLSAEISQ